MNDQEFREQIVQALDEMLAATAIEDRLGLATALRGVAAGIIVQTIPPNESADSEIAEAAFRLGEFAGTLLKYRKSHPDRVSNLYQRMLSAMPREEIATFLAETVLPRGAHD